MSSQVGVLRWHASRLGCQAIFPPSSALIFQRPPAWNSRFRPRSLPSAGPVLAHPAGLSRLTSWPAPNKTQPDRRTGLLPLFAAFFGGLTIDRVGVSDHSGDGVARGAPPPGSAGHQAHRAVATGRGTDALDVADLPRAAWGRLPHWRRLQGPVVSDHGGALAGATSTRQATNSASIPRPWAALTSRWSALTRRRPWRWAKARCRPSAARSPAAPPDSIH